MPSCGTEHSQRVDATAEDGKHEYNRAEHVRLHVKTGEPTGIYDQKYGWREDAESTSDRQYLVMLGFAIGRNSLARLLHRQRSADPPGVAA